MIAALVAFALAGAGGATPFRCGATERPGVAERGDDGVWRGIAVDLCRQAAQAEGSGEIAFHAYRSTADLRDSRHDALVVLSRAELAVAQPGARAPAGPPIAVSRQLLLVRAAAAWRYGSDLAGQRVCFIIATEAEQALNRWARRTGVAIRRVGFQEPVELRDALDAGYCAAMAADARDIPGGAQETRALGPALAELSLFVLRPRGDRAR